MTDPFNNISECDTDSYSHVKVSKDLYWGSDQPTLNRNENNIFTLTETNLNYKIAKHIGADNLKKLKELHMVRFLKNFCLLPKTQKIRFIEMCARSEIEVIIEN